MAYDAVFDLENSQALSRFLCEVSPGLMLEKNAPHSRSARTKLLQHSTPATIELVQKVYAQDLALFGYSSELDAVDVVPGECIIGGNIVPLGETDIAFPRRPTAVKTDPAFDAALRFHRVVETLWLG